MTSTPTATNPAIIAWNDPAILKAAGTSPDAIRQHFAKTGQPLPTDWAVYQWSSRRRIPDRWRAALVYALMNTNRITPRDLFRIVTHSTGPRP